MKLSTTNFTMRTVYFSDKGFNSTKATLVEKYMIITDEKQIANVMNGDFVSITKKLSLKPTISSKDSNQRRI